jgi:hypothetical protein
MSVTIERHFRISLVSSLRGRSGPHNSKAMMEEGRPRRCRGPNSKWHVHGEETQAGGKRRAGRTVTQHQNSSAQTWDKSAIYRKSGMTFVAGYAIEAVCDR